MYLNQTMHHMINPGSQLERSPRMRKVGWSNPSRDSPKLLKQVLTVPFLNALNATGPRR